MLGLTMNAINLVIGWSRLVNIFHITQTVKYKLVDCHHKDSPQQCTYIQHKTENIATYIASSTVHLNHVSTDICQQT